MLMILNTITFIFMVIMNALANILPFNGVDTGTVSDSYPNLFTPAPITFSIWIVIYLLLAGFIVYQFVGKGPLIKQAVKAIGLYFAVSSIANATWILSWHYYMITLSVIIMIVILVCLAIIVSELNKIDFSTKEKLFIKVPFSVYFGWITVATISNITALLVSYGWSGGGLSEQGWTVIVLIIGMIIGVTISLRNRDIAYALAIIWGYTGILIKHLSPSGFDGAYPSVIITAIACLVLLFMTIYYNFFKNR